MLETAERRSRQRDDLILAAERAIAAKGLTGLKSRDLAREIGCANGAVYNLVRDMDELVLLVGSQTLARLDAALVKVATAATSPTDALANIAVAYCDFAAGNPELWRTLFEHRMPPGKETPDWAAEERMRLFRHIRGPLAALFPARSEEQISITARSLFSAVHGMVLLGLERRLVAAPIDSLRGEIEAIVKATIDGLSLAYRC